MVRSPPTAETRAAGVSEEETPAPPTTPSAAPTTSSPEAVATPPLAGGELNPATPPRTGGELGILRVTIDGFPKPKYNASFGQTLMQSMHFIQPGSITIPYCFTSACTRTFEVQVAVQCPH